MSPVSGWTGRTACELQASLRMSNESFAGHLGIAVRTVASWHQKPYIRPRAEMQQLLDAALERASPADRARFAESLADATEVGGTERLEVDPAVADALEWLDRHAGRPPGQSYRDVSSRVARADADAIRAAGARRAAVGRAELVSALAFFRTSEDGHAAQARSAAPRSRQSETSAAKSSKANGHSTPSGGKTPVKSGFNLKLKDKGDELDKEFERF